MMEYKNILVGVDGSHQSEAAFEKAVATAKRNNGKLIIASVLNSEKYVGMGMGLGKAYINETVEDELLNDLKIVTDKLKEKAEAEGLTDVVVDVSTGNSKVALSEELVDKYGADLVVVGATGTNFVSRMLMGSNAQYVVQHGTVDTLVVRTNAEGRQLSNKA